ncbi:GPI transamidase component PIG-S-like [Limulus polyphemus]|uniref:GPI transamidase component PIG-S-like n=1 Tax=Limulus polyphemus TaxID=6850 RepID=A0ABM1BJW3_LIMPO|nr:GPI transamidase component PIG-S-like [Limulus polyphemus]
MSSNQEESVQQNQINLDDTLGDSSSSTVRDAGAVYAICTFALIFAFVGFPLWWKTTEVFRVPLPYQKMDSLPMQKVTHLIGVTVVLVDNSVEKSSLWEQLTLFNLKSSDQLEFKYHFNLREPFPEERRAIVESSNLIDLDRRLHELGLMKKIGSLWMYILPTNMFDLKQPTVGSHRAAYLHSPSSAVSLSVELMRVVSNMVEEKTLRKLFLPTSMSLKQPDKDTMRSTSAYTGLDVIFTLLSSQPEVYDIRWDIERAVEEYLKPFLEFISLIVNVDVKSQILFMTPLNLQPKFLNETEHIVSVDQLSLAFNPVESKLGSHSSLNPTLNFVTYVPPKEVFPLQIYTEKGERLTTNSFLSARWGGFYVYNIPPPTEGSALPSTVYLDVKQVMKVFLSQLKALIGIHHCGDTDCSGLFFIQNYTCTDWELDFLMRRQAQEQLAKALGSLHSLAHLLETISNIVITNVVGDKIYLAIDSLEKGIELLKTGNLEEAFGFIKRAFVSSEEAFYHPSLLALLYFPDDQKYAVYIPLFLPVSIPVILSLPHLWRFLQVKTKKKH